MCSSILPNGLEKNQHLAIVGVEVMTTRSTQGDKDEVRVFLHM
jgi:hypothetical protein